VSEIPGRVNSSKTPERYGSSSGEQLDALYEGSCQLMQRRGREGGLYHLSEVKGILNLRGISRFFLRGLKDFSFRIPK